MHHQIKTLTNDIRTLTAQIRAAVKPSGTGSGWTKKTDGWVWSDAKVRFAVTQHPGVDADTPVYTLTVLVSDGTTFRHTRPAQWTDPKGAFKAAMKWYDGLTAPEKFMLVDLTKSWQKVGSAP